MLGFKFNLILKSHAKGLYLLYYLMIYTVLSRQYFKILGEADDRTEKEEQRCHIFSGTGTG